MLFLMGYIKKACISDNIAPFVDVYFQSPAEFGLSSAWIATLLYAAQIYCDFSGYTDMAIAVAGLFGYRLTRNFNAPYLARNVTDFWHRWHISLSTWLRDYLYIPLGGNRHGKLNTHRNILITMLLGGLWHGASWNFVLWGFMHGVALSLHKLWTDARAQGRRGAPSPLTAGVSWAVTMLWVCLAWVPFRAIHFDTSLQVISTMFGAAAATGLRELPGSLWLLVGFLMLAHVVVQRAGLNEWWRYLPAPAFSAVYGSAWAVAIGFTATGHVPFIYFQF